VLWQWSGWKIALAAVAFGGVELTFLAANLSKIAHGGWLPLLIALGVLMVMTTWQRGRDIVTSNRAEKEGPLQAFVDDVRSEAVPRVPGTAIFPHPGKDTTPLALRANVEHNGILHRNVLIVSATTANVPHVPLSQALTVDDLGYDDDGIQHLSVRFGFSDERDLPRAVRHAAEARVVEPSVEDVDQSSYFLSRATLRRSGAPGMVRWRKTLFMGLAHNAADPAAYFHLPTDRTVTMGSDVGI
jgi:KUP system potassium uptake protein